MRWSPTRSRANVFAPRQTRSMAIRPGVSVDRMKTLLCLD